MNKQLTDDGVVRYHAQVQATDDAPDAPFIFGAKCVEIVSVS